MILKSADDHTADIQTLRALLQGSGVGAQTRRNIENEIRNIELGVRGEQEAAYEIDFHFGESANWAVLHDLRIETEQRVAQIDHLLINRLLEVWVCETKLMSGGLAINEYGECTTFLKGNLPQAIASPFEQNRKHCALLQALFEDANFPLPRRLGIAIRPSIHNVVLISKRARITRPKTKIEGIDSIIKADQLKAHIDKEFNDNPFFLAKLVSADTLANLAAVLGSLHCPKKIDWFGKFGLSPETAPRDDSAHSKVEVVTGVVNPETPVPINRRNCAACAKPLTDAVVRFCLGNRNRFGGAVYCRDCQQEITVGP